MVKDIISFLLEDEHLTEARPFQVQTRQLPREEAKALGYDVGEIDEFPIMRISIQGSFIDYEEGPHSVWILQVETEPNLRREGRAKYLLDFLKRYADQHELKVIHGTFTDDGERYLKPVVKRMWPGTESLDDDDEEEDASHAQDVHQVDPHELEDIKAAEPDFFSRKNMKEFGTKRIYQYGPFIVAKNRRKAHGHFGNISYYTNFVIYEFVKTHDAPQGTLILRGDSKSLSDAKEMIKLKDFRSRLERTREMIAKMGKPPVAENIDDDDDEFEAQVAKEVGIPSDLETWTEHNVLRQTENFALVRFQTGQLGLVCKKPNAHPERVKVPDSDVPYLMGLSPSSFDGSAVWDFGCGVWAGKDPENPEPDPDIG